MALLLTACKCFGVRTSNIEAKAKCQKCKEFNLELFKKCTVETNILMGTSIDIDPKGNTISIPPGKVSDTELMFEKFERSYSSTKKADSNTNAEKPKAAPNRVKGLAKMCREMRLAGKSDEEIRQAVAKRYVDVGKSVKDAEGKAKNWVKNMRWTI